LVSHPEDIRERSAEESILICVREREDITGEQRKLQKGGVS
jgi:hypothetical protein